MSHTFKFVLVAAGFSVAGWLVGFFMSDRAPAPTESAQTKASSEHASNALPNLTLGRSARDLPKSRNKQARNSESAIFAALREPNELRRIHDLMEAVSEMGIDWISSTLVLAQNLSAQEQESLMPVLVARWAELDPAAAAQFALTLPESVIRSMTMRATFGVWLASSPEEAMAWASSLPPGQERSRTIDEVVRALAQRDPASAMLLLERFPKDRARDSSSYNVFSEWAKSDPRAAADYWLKAIPASGQDVNGALAKIASIWARSDPQEAFTWAQKLPESTAKNSTLSIIVGAMAGRDPQQAASQVAQLGAASRASAAGEVALQWAQDDAAAAAVWAGSLPEDGARASAFRSIAQTWTGQDLGKVANWLDGLPASESRDAAVSAFTKQVSDSDPEAAVAWASTISDPNTSKVDLERIAITWMGRDEDAASRWITATPSLAEDAKARLLAVNK
jgi:hypothetical protein